MREAIRRPLGWRVRPVDPSPTSPYPSPKAPPGALRIPPGPPKTLRTSSGGPQKGSLGRPKDVLQKMNVQNKNVDASSFAAEKKSFPKGNRKVLILNM